MPWFQAFSSGFAPRHAKVEAIEQPGRGGGAVANISETGGAREAFDGMPDEVDFSESLPNPYVGKARRRVAAAADDGDHGRAAEDQWRDPLRRPSSSFQRQGL